MSIIIPAIIPTSRNDLTNQLTRFADIPDIDTVQIDIVDGRFAAPPSWPYTADAPAEYAAMIKGHERLPFAGRFFFDMDLMVANPEHIIGQWIALGATRLTIHAESTVNLPRLMDEMVHTYGYQKSLAKNFLSLGLALNITSDLSLIEPYLDTIDYVQCMGIAKIGSQGQPFDPRVTERVHALHKRHPDLPIQVDGGVTKASAPELLSAGASRIVVGHALREAHDLAATYAELSALSVHYGTYEN